MEDEIFGWNVLYYLFDWINLLIKQVKKWIFKFILTSVSTTHGVLLGIVWKTQEGAVMCTPWPFCWKITKNMICYYEMKEKEC